MRAGLLFALLLLPGLARAQDADSTRRRVDVSAALVESDTLGGARVVRLTGNVVVRQDSTTLTSQRATRYLALGEILFVGNVVVVERGDTLRAPEVRYNTRTKTGVALGPLRLSDGEVVVTAPRGEYFTREKRAVFAEGVQLVDSATVLTSRRGTYFSEEKRAEFDGDVRLEEPQSSLRADSVTYLRETKEAWARGRVFVERRGGEDAATADSTTRTFLFGSRAYNDERRGFSRVEGLRGAPPDTAAVQAAIPPDTAATPAQIPAGDALPDSVAAALPPVDAFAPGMPLLVQVRFDSTGAPADTLLMRAATLEAERTDTTQTLRAWPRVHLWTKDYAARADSLYSVRVSRDSVTHDDVRLFRDPIAWFEKVQVNADTLRMRATDGELDTLFARSNAFAAEEDTVTRRLNQFKGRAITMQFLPDSVRVIHIGPNAEAIYQQAKDGAPDGALEVSTDEIVVRLRGDVVRRVSALNDPVGDGRVQSTRYAESIVPAGLGLSGLRWQPEARPAKLVLLGTYELPPLTGSARPADASESDVQPLPDDR